MGIILDEAVVARNLVGEWRIGASNIGEWVDGSRRDAALSFTIAQETPLVIDEEQVFTIKDDKERRVLLTNRFLNGQFVSRGKGLIAGMSRWTISGIDANNGILIVRMTHARGGQDGLIVLVRKDSQVEELRTIIARHAGDLGLGPEDFASLTWSIPVSVVSAHPAVATS